MFYVTLAASRIEADVLPADASPGPACRVSAQAVKQYSKLALMSLSRILTYFLLLMLPASGFAQAPVTVDSVGGALYDATPTTQGGWKGLGRLLDHLAPQVDTRLPLAPSQVSERIQALLDNGDTQAALALIAQRKQQAAERHHQPGADVQLLFLEGRALAQAGRHEDAIAHYREMTQYYPELPEPWNNLASEYVSQGQLDLAEQALGNALATNPQYAMAQLNLGMVQLMRARLSFGQAAALGAPGAEALHTATTQLLQP